MRFWFLLYFSFLIWVLPAQNPWFVSVNYHYGWVMPHHPYMAILNQGHTQAIEINIGKQSTGTTPWQEAYNFPDFGLSIMAFDLANPTMLGNGFSAFPYVDFPLTKSRKAQPFIQWRLKFGYGIGYLTKIFDRKDNYKNIAIGSHFNAFIHLNNHVFVRLTSQWRISAGLSFSHFSNGAFKTPNLGINIPLGNFGITYYPKYSAPSKKYNKPEKTDTINHSKSFDNLLIVSGGLKEITPYYGPKYGVFNIHYAKIYHHTIKSTFGLGAEINYNRANAVLYQRVYDKPDALSSWQAGVSAQYYLMLGKTRLFFYFGTYLFNRYRALSMFYHRIGGIHQIYKHWYFNLSLRTHFAVADNIEWGIAYQW